MAAHGRGGQAGGLGQLARTARPFAQQLDDLTAMWIGQGGKGRVETGGGGHQALKIVVFRPIVSVPQSSGPLASTVWDTVQMCPSGSLQR